MNSALSSIYNPGSRWSHDTRKVLKKPAHQRRTLTLTQRRTHRRRSSDAAQATHKHAPAKGSCDGGDVELGGGKQQLTPPGVVAVVTCKCTSFKAQLMFLQRMANSQDCRHTHGSSNPE
ncbi:hypothetical protein V5799_014496 [Amblyomma americanum]|uniref:Uncharacterized protein n=1 Tax=Amblyomma americanum TaxID=6943 RepID=A0AAQ4E2V2_AMBAM